MIARLGTGWRERGAKIEIWQLEPKDQVLLGQNVALAEQSANATKHTWSQNVFQRRTVDNQPVPEKWKRWADWSSANAAFTTGVLDTAI